MQSDSRVMRPRPDNSFMASLDRPFLLSGVYQLFTINLLVNWAVCSTLCTDRTFQSEAYSQTVAAAESSEAPQTFYEQKVVSDKREKTAVVIFLALTQNSEDHFHSTV